jgi:hypothetical protein
MTNEERRKLERMAAELEEGDDEDAAWAAILRKELDEER